IASQSSVLTTRRDDVAFNRSGAALQTMRAMRLTEFNVTPGHEGRFVRAARASAEHAAAWLLYEANDSSRFVIVMPVRSTAEGDKMPALPHRFQELKGDISEMRTGVYAVRRHTSR